MLHRARRSSARLFSEIVEAETARLRANLQRLEQTLPTKFIPPDPQAIEAADRAGYERGFREGANAAKAAILPKAEAVAAAAQELRTAAVPQPEYRPPPMASRWKRP